jgi:hypothetical protein
MSNPTTTICPSPHLGPSISSIFGSPVRVNTTEIKWNLKFCLLLKSTDADDITENQGFFYFREATTPFRALVSSQYHLHRLLTDTTNSSLLLAEKGAIPGMMPWKVNREQDKGRKQRKLKYGEKYEI